MAATATLARRLSARHQFEARLVVDDLDAHQPALGQLAKQQLFRQGFFDVLLNRASQRSRAIGRFIALLGQPDAGVIAQLDGHATIGQLVFQLHDELVHHLGNDIHGQAAEGNDRVQTIAEFGGEQPLDGFLVFPQPLLAAEPHRRLCQVGRPGVGGHDQDDVAEVDRLAVVVGQFAVVHDLQQDIEQIGMGLFDFIQQQHGMRVLIHRIGQHAALVEADIARRGADQPGDGVTLHVLGHVETGQFNAQGMGQLPRRLGLAHPGGAGKQIAADWLFGFAQPRPRQLDGAGQRGDGLILTEDHGLQVALQILQRLLVVARHGFRRNARDLGDHRLHFLHPKQLLALGGGLECLGRAGLVNHVYRLVGKLAVADIAMGQLNRAAQRLVGVAHAVMRFIVRLEPFEDLDRILDRRLVHVDLLKAPHQRAVLFEVVAIFLVGGRTNAAQAAVLQRGLEQIRRIHRPAGGGSGADHRVNFIDKEHTMRRLFQLQHYRLQPFLEITAIAGSGQQRAHIQRIDRRLRQNLRHLFIDDAFGQAFGDRRLANPGVTDIKRVVLGAAAKHLDGAFDFGFPADQRIDLAVLGFLVQVDAIGVQRFVALLLASFAGFRATDHVVLHALHRLGLLETGDLGDAMADIVHRVQARHVLLLQEIDGVAFTLREHCHQHIGPGHFLATGGLHVDGGALQHTLETGSRFGFTGMNIDQV